MHTPNIHHLALGQFFSSTINPRLDAHESPPNDSAEAFSPVLGLGPTRRPSDGVEALSLSRERETRKTAGINADGVSSRAKLRSKSKAEAIKGKTQNPWGGSCSLGWFWTREMDETIAWEHCLLIRRESGGVIRGNTVVSQAISKTLLVSKRLVNSDLNSPLCDFSVEENYEVVKM